MEYLPPFIIDISHTCQFLIFQSHSASFCTILPCHVPLPATRWCELCWNLPWKNGRRNVSNWMIHHAKRCHFCWRPCCLDWICLTGMFFFLAGRFLEAYYWNISVWILGGGFQSKHSRCTKCREMTYHDDTFFLEIPEAKELFMFIRKLGGMIHFD